MLTASIFAISLPHSLPPLSLAGAVAVAGDAEPVSAATAFADTAIAIAAAPAAANPG